MATQIFTSSLQMSTFSQSHPLWKSIVYVCCLQSIWDWVTAERSMNLLATRLWLGMKPLLQSWQETLRRCVGIVQCNKTRRHNHGEHLSLPPLLLAFTVSEFMMLCSSLTFHILIKPWFSSFSSFGVFILKTRRATSFKELTIKSSTERCCYNYWKLWEVSSPPEEKV